MKYEIGNCYEEASSAIALAGYRCDIELPDLEPGALKNATLVHGIPRHALSGVRYGHAWIEFGDRVYHPSNDGWVNHIPREVYYRVGHIDEDETVRYEGDRKVRRMLVEHEHYGPWHEHPDDVLFGPGHDTDEVGGVIPEHNELPTGNGKEVPDEKSK